MFSMKDMTEETRYFDNNQGYKKLWDMFEKIDRLNLGPGQLRLDKKEHYIKIVFRGGYRGVIYSGGNLKLESNSVSEVNIVKKMLDELNADPIGIAMQCGVKTGVCCVCSRQLTDAISITQGIGPICLRKMS